MEDYPWKNLKTLIEDKGEKNGNQVFMFYEDRIFTYKEIHESSNIIARNLRGLGINKGDHVLVFLYNSPEYVIIWFALAKLGAVMIPVNTAFRQNDLRHIIEDSEARTIILETELLGSYQELRNRVNIKREIIIPTNPGDSTGDMIPFKSLEEGTCGNLDTEIEMFDPVTIMYTGGTTGRAKGVELPHFAYIVSALEMAKYACLKAGDRMLTALPLFHVGAQQVVVIPSLITDNSFALIRRFSASKFWDQVRKYNCNVIHCIRSLAYILYKQKEKPDDANNPAERALGGGMDKEIWRKFEKRFNLTYLAFYGLTEFGCLTTYTPAGQVKIGSIGVPVPYQRVEIVNENDEILSPYEHGEIVIRPEVPYSMMLGYYKKAEETIKTWRNLWFHTGDIAYKDEEGCFYFVGRRSYFIKHKGENISAEEVEEVIDSHPKVKQSGVVGVPNDIGDEDVKVYIVSKEKASILPEDIIKWCDGKLAYFKIPRYVEFVDDLPIGAMNKVERYKLKERGIGNAWDREKVGYKLIKK